MISTNANKEPIPIRFQNKINIADTSGQDTLVEKEKSRKPIYIAAASAATILLIIFAIVPYYSQIFSADEVISRESIRTSVVRQGLLESDVVAQGRIVTANSPTLFSPVVGNIDLKVKAGDAVDKGQLLAEISSPTLIEELAREESKLSGIKIQLERQKIEARRQQLELKQTEELAQVSLKAMEREMLRAKASMKLQLISDLDYRTAEDELEKAKLEYRQAQQNYSLEKEALSFETQNLALQVEHQELIVEGIKRQIEELKIISPVTGMVGNVQVEPFAAITQHQALITVIDLTSFEVEARVSQRYADELSVSMTAEIRLNGQNFTGEIVGISPEVINNEVITRIRFTGNKPSQLRQNQRLTARIILQRKENVLLVDKGSIIDNFQGNVFKITNNEAQRISIQIGSTSVQHLEITSGLEPGDEIIIAGPAIESEIQSILITN